MQGPAQTKQSQLHAGVNESNIQSPWVESVLGLIILFSEILRGLLVFLMKEEPKEGSKKKVEWTWREHRHGLTRAVAAGRRPASHYSLVFIAHLACLDPGVPRIQAPIFGEAPKFET